VRGQLEDELMEQIGNALKIVFDLDK